MKNARNKNTKSQRNNAGRRQRNNGAPARSRAIALSNGTAGRMRTPNLSGVGKYTKKQVLKHGLDAFHNCHVPLPRAVAPYITVRTVRTFSSPDKLVMFGTTIDGRSRNEQWTNCVAITSNAPANGLNTASYTHITIPIPGNESNGFLECTPASMSVQVMSSTALQTADGVFYAGRTKTGLTAPENTDDRTIQSLMDGLVAFAPPRILTGSKLALGAVQIDNIPGNMSSLANFTPILEGGEGPNRNWRSDAFGQFSGFNPSYIINNGGKELQYIVAVEWRARVSPFNPLSSSAVQHVPTSDSLWSEIMSAASAFGHGVQDVIQLLEDVA